MVLEGTPFAEIGGNVFSSILSKGILFIGALIVVGIIFGVAWYIRWRRQFNIIVEIYSERSRGVDFTRSTDRSSEAISRMMDQGNYKIIFDKGAIIYSRKDKGSYFRLLEEKVDLPVPPFNVLQPSSKGNILKLWQKSNEEYVYLLPDKIDKTVLVRADGNTYAANQVSQKQVEGDIAYWNIKRKEEHKKLFDTESLLMKVLPIIAPIIVGALILFMVYIVLDKISVIEGVAVSLEKAAASLAAGQQAQAATGTATLTTATVAP